MLGMDTTRNMEASVGGAAPPEDILRELIGVYCSSLRELIKMEMIYMALFLAALLGALFILRIPSAKGKEIKDFKTVSKEGLRTYSKDDVCLHNKRDDCWIIVKNKVYDVTPYVEEHPGGDAILMHAGDDSTEGFYGPQHATRVFDMIDEFYVGDLKP